MNNICKHPTCNKPASVLGYCRRHYLQFHKYKKTFNTRFDDNEFIIQEDYCIIPIKYKSIIKNVIIDIDDIEKCKKYKWCIQEAKTSKSNNYIRVCCHINNKTIKLHRYILNETNPSIEIDHINGNTLDNRKNNLRLCKHINNMKNQKLNKNNTSGYKGVYYNKTTNKWWAEIHYNNKKIWLGSYIELNDAIKARKEAETKYFGEYMRTSNCL